MKNNERQPVISEGKGGHCIAISHRMSIYAVSMRAKACTMIARIGDLPRQKMPTAEDLTRT
jgi:hypothetical protein